MEYIHSWPREPDKEQLDGIHGVLQGGLKFWLDGLIFLQAGFYLGTNA